MACRPLGQSYKEQRCTCPYSVFPFRSEPISFPDFGYSFFLAYPWLGSPEHPASRSQIPITHTNTCTHRVKHRDITACPCYVNALPRTGSPASTLGPSGLRSHRVPPIAPDLPSRHDHASITASYLARASIFTHIFAPSWQRMMQFVLMDRRHICVIRTAPVTDTAPQPSTPN